MIKIFRKDIELIEMLVKGEGVVSVARGIFPLGLFQSGTVFIRNPHWGCWLSKGYVSRLRLIELTHEGLLKRKRTDVPYTDGPTFPDEKPGIEWTANLLVLQNYDCFKEICIQKALGLYSKWEGK